MNENLAFDNCSECFKVFMVSHVTDLPTIVLLDTENGINFFGRHFCFVMRNRGLSEALVSYRVTF